MEDKHEKKTGLFAKLAAGLSKTRNNISELFGGVFGGGEIDEEFYEELEEALLVADVGYQTTEQILLKLRERVKECKLQQKEEARAALARIAADMMRDETPFLAVSPTVLLIVGVNGVGKTTTIGKLAHWIGRQNKCVILAAADTFRAAATEQLAEWGERSGVAVVKHGEGADPAAVVYDAVASAKAKGADVLICDTAGRLHNKKNLMDELAKIGRVLAREYAEAQSEVLLVLDATTGQNAIAQARVFAQTVPLSGLILTKLDGTAKGGVVIAVKNELRIPIRFVGVGEGIEDLQPFDPDVFAQALFK